MSHESIGTLAREDEATHAVPKPRPLLDRAVPDPLVAGDNDQSVPSDDGEPVVVLGVPEAGTLGQAASARSWSS